MWLIFGIFAIVAAFFGLLTKGKKSIKFTFASLAFTAMTVCAVLSMSAGWVIASEWSALQDVVPTMAKAFWILVMISIVVNGVSIIISNKNTDK